MASKAKGKSPEKDQMEDPLDEQELESLYAWVDDIPLSRPKRNISRDFSDGVCVAEVIKHYFPNEGLVDTHNYTCANNTNKKKENWYYLNRKVFSKLNFELAEEVINDLVQCKPGMIEKVLLMLQVKIRRAEYGRAKQSDKPEADQHQMTPGRKDTRKLGMEDIKGGRFAKTKHRITKSRLNLNAPVKRFKEKEIKYEPKKKVKFKDEKDSKIKKERRVENIPPRHRIKMPIMETDVVPRIMLEEREQEVLAKDEMIKILQAKISRLEHLLHLKDMRIDDLQGRVESMRPTGIKK